MKKSELERKLKAAEHLMNARAKHIERLKMELQVKEAIATVSQAYISYLAGGKEKVIIPKKDLAKFLLNYTIVADHDKDNYILQVVEKDDIQNPME